MRQTKTKMEKLSLMSFSTFYNISNNNLDSKEKFQKKNVKTFL